MSQPGVGAMLHHLSGGSRRGSKEFAGKEISSAVLEDNTLKISFTDGIKIRVWDDGQSCCESRYITTDDNPASLVGGKLIHIASKPGPDVERDYDVHETCFIEVQTDKGHITLTTHNEHNGYYGGFGLSIDEVKE